MDHYEFSVIRFSLISHKSFSFPGFFFLIFATETVFEVPTLKLFATQDLHCMTFSLRYFISAPSTLSPPPPNILQPSNVHPFFQFFNHVLRSRWSRLAKQNISMNAVVHEAIAGCRCCRWPWLLRGWRIDRWGAWPQRATAVALPRPRKLLPMCWPLFPPSRRRVVFVKPLWKGNPPPLRPFYDPSPATHCNPLPPHKCILVA